MAIPRSHWHLQRPALDPVFRRPSRRRQEPPEVAGLLDISNGPYNVLRGCGGWVALLALRSKAKMRWGRPQQSGQPERQRLSLYFTMTFLMETVSEQLRCQSV